MRTATRPSAALFTKRGTPRRFQINRPESDRSEGEARTTAQFGAVNQKGFSGSASDFVSHQRQLPTGGVLNKVWRAYLRPRAASHLSLSTLQEEESTQGRRSGEA